MLNDVLNVKKRVDCEYKLNIKHIVEYIIQTEYKIRRFEYCYIWLAIQHIASDITTRCDNRANDLFIVLNPSRSRTLNILYLVEELAFVRVRN